MAAALLVPVSLHPRRRRARRPRLVLDGRSRPSEA